MKPFEFEKDFRLSYSSDKYIVNDKKTGLVLYFKALDNFKDVTINDDIYFNNLLVNGTLDEDDTKETSYYIELLYNRILYVSNYIELISNRILYVSDESRLKIVRDYLMDELFDLFLFKAEYLKMIYTALVNDADVKYALDKYFNLNLFYTELNKIENYYEPSETDYNIGIINHLIALKN